MAKDREAYNMGLALLGNFNPVIITPQWLAAKGIIRESEADSAKVEVIHPEFTRFDLDWISVQTSLDRIDFKTKRESHIGALKDLVVSIFRILKETPISAFGINHFCHYTLKDFNEYANFGYWLSPVREFSDVLSDPKVMNIEYIETKTESSNGILRLTIMPSDLILDRKSVLFNCNHHFDSNKKSTQLAIDLLLDNWDFSIQKVNSLCDAVWERAKI